jgi:hypothetical protein
MLKRHARGVWVPKPLSLRLFSVALLDEQEKIFWKYRCCNIAISPTTRPTHDAVLGVPKTVLFRTLGTTTAGLDAQWFGGPQSRGFFERLRGYQTLDTVLNPRCWCNGLSPTMTPDRLPYPVELCDGGIVRETQSCSNSRSLNRFCYLYYRATSGKH